MYIDVGGKTILDAFLKFQAVLYAACVAGDALAADVTNEGFILADDSSSIAADCFALEDGAAGDTIWMAKAIVVEVRPTESNGVWSDGVLALAADVMDPLYLGESGKLEDSVGTTPQVCGRILSTTRAYFCADGYLTSTDLSLSGTLAVGGASTFTGIATFTAAPIFSAGFVVPTGKDITLTKGNVTLTEGNVVLTAGYVQNVRKTAKAETATLTVAECGYVEVTCTADVELTLPAAAAGLEFIFYHLASVNTLKITAGASDKLLNAAGAAKDNVSDDKAIGNLIWLRAVDAVNWVTLARGGAGGVGVWTYA
ncbi:MAG: hypothetical protein PHG35_03315 [Dehalococcoidales bacterium]|nr:hypothetical protein [Dehalococcoidales bacterium]